jgi:hypothetical protein
LFFVGILHIPLRTGFVCDVMTNLRLHREENVNVFHSLWAEHADKSVRQKTGAEWSGTRSRAGGQGTVEQSAANTTESIGRPRLQLSPEQSDRDSEEEQDGLAVDLRRPPGHGVMSRLAQRLWEQSVRLPRAVSNGALVVVRGGLSQTGGKDALFLVGGGTDKEVLDCVWLLDEVGNKWRQVSTLPQACWEHSATWHNGALWVIGGFDGFKSRHPLFCVGALFL